MLALDLILHEIIFAVSKYVIECSKIVGIPCGQVVPPMTTFLLREMDKVELISVNITTYIIQGQWNRFSGRWTNVCNMMPEKPADMISGSYILKIFHSLRG